MRLVWQVRYLIFNWAYSTNHKRISINYFWFVLFSGVVGMVLATIIRLEMAYPGVGILAGDNAQYLSIATAHGVIMVFFMAMPLLFGFLGNFLLPTQMGVHDVAYPRMNSAAFWFLPASLLALCQLVCIDRRYQRMNCFNVRELQSLLRNRFFQELTPSSLIFSNNESGKTLLNYMNARSGTSSISNTSPFSNFFLFNPSNSLNLHSFNFRNFEMSGYFFNLNSIFNKNLTSKLSTQGAFSLNPVFFINFHFNWAGFNFLWVYSIINSSNFYHWQRWNFDLKFLHLPSNNSSLFGLPKILNSNELGVLNQFPNYNNLSRFVEFENPNYVYKIKIGNYLADSYVTNFPFLINTIASKSLLGLNADWFFNRQLNSFWEPLLNFKLDGGRQFSVNLNKLNIPEFLNFKISTYGNYQSREDSMSKNLFFSQSKQSRVLNNWRDLKLSREGWRCRMLSARHQKSMFHRYVNENEVIWVVEKNAKDLLPGWAMITPFSSRTRYTLVGKTDIGICIVAITLVASMISSANFLMTYRYLSTLNNRKMRDARSFFTESVIAASWMMLAANPMLILGLFMLIADRHWKTSFFDYSGGGDTILFQHMFWFFGHPEVYIIIVPCFGITNTLMSFYLRKRISARASLLYSLYTIAFLGFFVWGHHMYMVGLAHTTRMLYSTLTVMISVPAATKIMHWLVTFVNSSIHFELPFILTLFFIFYFLSGGISGMAVAHTGMDVLFHDTFYVIGHFHVMLAGSLMFAGFASFYFYLPSLFGVRYSRAFAYLHVFYYSVGQIFTVIPMIWLGYLGMPRRVLDYPAAMGGWHSLTSSAHIITVSGILAFVIMLFDSLRKQKSYTIKTFGVGRYNTRLNFYLYQIARNRYWISKHFTLLPVRSMWHSKNTTQVHNLTSLDSTLFFYTFTRRELSNSWSYI